MDHPFMARAIQFSTDNVHSGDGPFGAVVAKDGTIIAKGANQITLNNDPAAHAEMLAIPEMVRKAALAVFRAWEGSPKKVAY